jgi:isoquinoline 1-oxidoreductase alpha subunit
MASKLMLNVNGIQRSVSVRSTDMPLLWVLRDILGLTGTKYGCGIEVCGACTVLIDGEPQRSCSVDVGSAAGRRILTIEGLSGDPAGRKAQAA